MGTVCCKPNLGDCCTRPMRFFGAQRSLKHRFRRLTNDCVSPALNLDSVVHANEPAEREGNLSDGDEAITSRRLVFSKDIGALHEYVNFPFLIDKELGEWLVQTRFMIILRGPPGSGKSYIASCIKTRYPTAEIFSSDYFWCRESGGLEYHFDQSRLEEAHEDCRIRTEEAAGRGGSPLVIDCTNIRAYEVHAYTDLARRFDYISILVTPHTPWRFDVDELADRTVHRVPLEEVRWKVRQFEPVYPLYYGWFWAGERSCNHFTTQWKGNKICPRKDTDQMVTDAYSDFKSILNVPTTRTQLAIACGLDPNIDPEELASYWRSSVVPNFGPPPSQGGVLPSRPHITAMFADSGKANGAKDYAEKRVVSEALLGTVQSIQVVGLFVTKRTVGLRIRLEGDEVLDLWNSEDDACLGPDSSSNPRPKGCRAHCTLALAPNVRALETGFDALRIFDAEASGRIDASQVPLPKGLLREIVLPFFTPTASPPEHVFYYQFNKARSERVLYAGYY